MTSFSLQVNAERLLSQSYGGGVVPSFEIVQSADAVAESVARATWQEGTSVLIDTICDLRSVVNILIAGISKLRKDELEDEVKQPNSKVSRLERNEQKLIVGQIAYMVDNCILTHVMNGIDHDESVYTIQDMEKAIGKKRRYTDVFHSEEERLSAERRWNALKLHIGWQNSHYRDIDYLKTMQVDEAHLKLTHSQLREVIDKVCWEDKHLKGVCEKFLEMLQKLY